MTQKIYTVTPKGVQAINNRDERNMPENNRSLSYSKAQAFRVLQVMKGRKPFNRDQASTILSTVTQIKRLVIQQMLGDLRKKGFLRLS